VALDRGILAPPPGLDYRNGQTNNQCVNQFQNFFLSELVLHNRETAMEGARTRWIMAKIAAK